MSDGLSAEVMKPETANRILQALARHPLYFILDSSLCDRQDALGVARAAMAGGVKVLQIRFKDLSNRSYLELARSVRDLSREHNCLMIVNDRLDIALLSGADGIHVGPEDYGVADIREVSRDLIVGRSARTPEDALLAQAAGADYVGSGAVFASSTKPGAPVIGVEGLKAIASTVQIPVVGIGGVTLENCPAVLDSGAAGFCSIAPFVTTGNHKELAAAYGLRGNPPQSAESG